MLWLLVNITVLKIRILLPARDVKMQEPYVFSGLLFSKHSWLTVKSRSFFPVGDSFKRQSGNFYPHISSKIGWQLAKHLEFKQMISGQCFCTLLAYNI